MEREPPEVARRLMRAARSLNYNRELQPLVEERIERAEGTLRGYLMANGRTALRLGAFQVEMDEEGEICLSRVPLDEWQQMRLPGQAGNGQPEMDVDGPEIEMASAVEEPRPERREQEAREEANILYERAG